MRIVEVRAHAFGPLVDSTLPLAPGMTVIVGQNESAKSSWHAAAYTALCGRRRGKGASTKEDRRFSDLHRPWDRAEWEVSAAIELTDGRRIELHHDLAGNVDCRATDLVLGRDVSNEIMFEGSPDGSRWLGLDRRTFLNTACIGQTELLGVLDSADGLQSLLQRAAAAAGASDTTVAEALELIERFQSDRVGLDRSNSAKPLRRTKDAVNLWTARLAEARQAHDSYLGLVEELEHERVRSRAADEELARLNEAIRRIEQVRQLAAGLELARERSAAAIRSEGELRERVANEQPRLGRIRQLSNQFAGVAPPAFGDLEERTRTVVAALAGWRSAPAQRPLAGRSSSELEAELLQTPTAPEGPTEMESWILQLVTELQGARAVVTEHQASRPPQPEDPSAVVRAAVAAGPQHVRMLATDIERVSGEMMAPPANEPLAELRRADGAAVARVSEAERAEREALALLNPSTSSVSPQPHGHSRTQLVVGVIGSIVGVVLAAGGALIPAIAVAGVALGLVIYLSLKGSHAPVSSSAQPVDQMAALQTAREQLNAARSARELTTHALTEAEMRAAAVERTVARSRALLAELQARCSSQHLPSEPAGLRLAAAQAEQAMAARSAWESWTAEASRFDERSARMQDDLVRALAPKLATRATAESADVDVLVARYRSECAARLEQAREASNRPALEAALNDRRTSESIAATAAVTRLAARTRLVSAAVECHLRAPSSIAVADDAEADRLVDELEVWLTGQQSQAEIADVSRTEWNELGTLLGGTGLHDVEAAFEALEAAHQAAADSVSNCDAHVDRLSGEFDLIVLPAEVPSSTPLEEIPLGLLLDSLAQHRVETDRVSKDLRAAVDNASGVVDERSRTLASVAEVEEQLAAAQAAMARVQDLASVLDATRGFLTQARDRAHRSIAPVLARAVQASLAEVTDGRYTDAIVDPGSLQVNVRCAGGPWRQADLLSVGTAEQIYLLLRIALAEHLTAPGEVCPLLLDDVTVQADAQRTVQILDMLLHQSNNRQIVLFSQEREVAEWARAKLMSEDRHSFLELAQIPM